MAKKSIPPPSPLSEDDSSSEGSSSSDEEQPATTNATPKPVPPSKTREEEEESDDESEAESDEESGDAEEADDDKKSRPSVSVPPTKAASESEDDESDSDSEAAKLVTPISSKPMAEVATADKEKANIKSSSFQRIWTLEDELTVLRGLVQFQAEQGNVNNSLIRGFYDFIKKKLSVEATSTQLVAKLRNLKKKYLGIAARSVNGKSVQPLKPHDNAVYELGKKIWSEEDECNGRVLNGVVTNGAVESLKAKCPFLKNVVESMGKRCAEEHLEILDITKAEFLEKKLKKQKMTVYKRGMQEGDLTKEMLKVIIEGIDRATS